MTTRPTIDDTLELLDGARRVVLARGGPPGLEPARASALIERVAADVHARARLVAWSRRALLGASASTSDARALALLLREVDSGWVSVRANQHHPWSAYTHRLPHDHDYEPAPLEPGQPREPVELDECRVEYLGLGDFNFSTDRALMLPGPSSESLREGDEADGIALIAGLLAHLRRLDDERRVLVAGHTDAAGSVAHNLALSEQRARSVKLACDGDAEGFADHALSHAAVADGQEVLRWIARRFGWSCDPGPVDDDDGPRTSAARQQFRARVETEYAIAAGTGDAFERGDWLGFFRLYEQDLGARLGLSASGLAELRARLVWTSPALLGCGEHWPEDELSRARVNWADRRVELLCFGPDQVPSGAGQPPGASVYGDPRYRWFPIRPGPGPHPLDGPCFNLGLCHDDLEQLDGVDEGAHLHLRGGPYDLRHGFADASERGGYLVFHFHGIAKGQRYGASIVPGDGAGDGGEAIVLFEGASLDAFIDAVGDQELHPEPIAIHLPRRPEPWKSGIEPE